MLDTKSAIPTTKFSLSDERSLRPGFPVESADVTVPALRVQDSAKRTPRIRLLSQTAAARIRQFGIRFPNELHAVLAARKSAFTLAAGFFLVPLAMPCETAFSTAPLLTPFFTAFRTAFSIFLTALVCFLAIVHSLRSEDDLQLEIVHGQDAVNGAPGQAYSTKLPKMRLCDRSICYRKMCLTRNVFSVILLIIAIRRKQPQ